MRKELNNIEKIEKYLLNELSAEEKHEFEKAMAENAELKNAVNAQKNITRSLRNSYLKSTAKKSYSKYRFNKNIFKGGATTVLITFIAVGSFFTYSYFNSNSQNNTNELPELNENGEKFWADADKQVPYAFFEINTEKDTVIETEGGIVLAIPANCFMDESGKTVNGKVKIEMKEALTAQEILKSGLSTKSGNELLETGGMFYFNARQNEKSLKINSAKGIHAEIPTNEIKSDMMLYEGARKNDGTIDWIKPQPLEKFLTTVPMTSLDLYPPNYIDSLAAMGKDFQNKIYTDSLYFSFARLWSETDSSAGATTGNWKNVAIKEIENDVVSSNYNFTSKDKNITNSVTYQGNDTLQRFINHKISQQMFDYYKRKNCTISYAEIGGKTTTTIVFPNTATFKASTKDTATLDALIGINPAKVQAIWNAKFDNTLLATKAFEERMRWIHHSCNNNVLDIYVNNLDKKLCTLDSLAANTTTYHKEKFLEFAQRGEGRVQTDKPHFEKLKKYYAQREKLFTEAANKTAIKHNQKQIESAEKFRKESEKYSMKDSQNKQNAFAEEFELNYDDACRQLGYIRIKTPPKAVYTVTITNPGWKNLDRAVRESLLARKTMNYTDPNSGKTATIKYQKIEVKVNERENYDACFVYLIPDKINSYFRMEEKENVFSEKLNELLNYEMVVVAFKNKQAFYYYDKQVSPKNYTVSPEQIESEKLDQKLSLLNKSGQSQTMIEEVAYRYTQQKENLRIKKESNDLYFTMRIGAVIFPCYAGKYVDFSALKPGIKMNYKE